MVQCRRAVVWSWNGRQSWSEPSAMIPALGSVTPVPEFIRFFSHLFRNIAVVGWWPVSALPLFYKWLTFKTFLRLYLILCGLGLIFHPGNYRGQQSYFLVVRDHNLWLWSISVVGFFLTLHSCRAAYFAFLLKNLWLKRHSFHGWNDELTFSRRQFLCITTFGVNFFEISFALRSNERIIVTIRGKIKVKAIRVSWIMKLKFGINVIYHSLRWSER